MKMLCKDEIPARVVDVTHTMAVRIVIYSNMMRRRRILPSEKGRALALRNEYMYRDCEIFSGGDMKDTWVPMMILRDSNENDINAHGHLRLNHLIPQIANLVDENQLALATAVELSHFTVEQQEMIFKYFFRHRLASLKKGMVKKMKEAGDDLTWKKIGEIAKEMDKPKMPSADDVIKPYQKYFNTRLELLNKIDKLFGEYTGSIDKAVEQNQ